MTSKNILLVLSLFALVVLISARDNHESSSNSKADVMNGETNNGLDQKSESDSTDQNGVPGGWQCGWSSGPGGYGWGCSWSSAPGGGPGGDAPPPLGGVPGGPPGGAPSGGSAGGGSGSGGGHI